MLLHFLGNKIIQRNFWVRVGLPLTRLRGLKPIASTVLDLADIAIGAGFSSQSHLTSTLKKRRGITPLRLRREAARAGAPHG